MSDLIFMRHAATDMAGTFCGHSDPPLSTSGRTQVSELVSLFKHTSIEAIYSSDLSRATETATPIAKSLDLPLYLSPNLREMHFGEWEGLRWSAIEERDRDFARRWLESFPSLTPPGGEDIGQFEKRIVQEVMHLKAQQNTKILVITHGGPMRVVLRTLLGYSDPTTWDMTKEYCSSFEYADKVYTHEVKR